MSWTINEHPTALQYFTSLVQSDQDFPLLEAAISIAQDAEPDLDLQAVMAEVDRLQVRLNQRLAGETDALRSLGLLNQFFYSELGFAGNLNNYYDPANSYLHHVLQTRRGIPVSLAVLWLELAASIHLSVEGVSFPGHFLIKVLLPQGHVVLDPMTGESLSGSVLAERLEPFAQSESLDAQEGALLSLYLQAAKPRSIVERMLRNLQEIHRAQREWSLLVSVLTRLSVLLPQVPEIYRDRGLAYADWGVTERALEDLEHYRQQVQMQGVELEQLDKKIDELRKNLG